jgi:hypothetical protein
METTVLVLNRNYEVLREATLKKVLTWISKNKIEIIVEDDVKTIASVSIKIKMPLVVRLLEFIGWKPNYDRVIFSTNAVYERDQNICQYWHYDTMGKRFKYRCSDKERTIDHIMPVSRGGRSDFINCVCACRRCNEQLKRNRTPEEAEMRLFRKPFVPKRKYFLFKLNPNKLAHRVYLEKVLRRSEI